jgi:hypothetical protein
MNGVVDRALEASARACRAKILLLGFGDLAPSMRLGGGDGLVLLHMEIKEFDHAQTTYL